MNPQRNFTCPSFPLNASNYSFGTSLLFCLDDVKIEIGPDGAFVRTAAEWKNWVKRGSPQFPPEKDRYHLYVAG
jgi:hypothetical protein